jgi:hypothetical protein
MANEFVTRTGLIVSGSTYLPAATSASKGHILSFDASTKEVYYMSTSSVTVTVPGSDTQVIYNNGGAFGASPNFVFSGSNIGIGTSSPSYKLDVYGSPRFYGDGNHIYTRIFSGASNKDSKILIGNDAERFNIGLAASSNTFSINSSNGGTPTSINIDYTTGNVGIGTTSPAEKLDVSGSIKILYPTGKLYAAATPSFYGEITPFNASGQMIFNVNYPEGNIIFQSGSVEVARFKDAKLGIGTDSPNVTLEANGIIRSDRVGVASQYVQINGGDAAGPFITAAGAAKVLTIQNNSTTSSDIFFDQAVASTYQFKQATVTKMILDASGNVGIGTTSPSYKLHVVGEIYASSNLFGSVVYSNTYRDQAGGTITFQDDGGSVAINKGSANATLDVSGSVLISGSLTVSGSSTFTNIGPAVFTGSITQNASTASFGGLVGIGTTTPSTTLDVNGRAIVGGGLSGNALSISTSVGTYTFNGYDLLTPSSFIITAGSSGYLTLDGYPVIFKVSGGEKMRVNTDGNVGIGTTAPNSTFQVSKGGVTFQVTDTNKTANNTFSVYGLTQTSWAIATGNSGSFSGGEKIVIADSGNVGIGVDNPSYKLQANGNIAATNSTGSGLFSISGTRSIAVQSFSGDWNYLRSNGANLVFGTQDSANLYIRTNDTDRMIVTTAGNVGINTSSPNAKLDVNGNVLVTGSLTVSGSSTFTNIGPAVFTGSITQNASTASFGGLVGIGTTTPSHKLQVVGPGTFASSTTNVDGNVGLYMSIGGSASNYNGILFQGVSVADMYFGRAAGAGVDDLIIYGAGELVRFKQNGNVGIGTSTPSNKLQVAGGVTATSFTGSFLGSVSAPGSTTQIVYNSGGALAADSGLVYSGSRVGIGTTTPANNLHIYGTGDQIIKIENSGTYLMYLGLVSNEGYIGSTNATPLTFYTNNVNRMYINTAGNIGIGTTSPGAKLHVVGTESRFGGVASGFISVYNANSRSGYFQANEGSDFRIASDINDMTFYVSGSEKVRFTSAGNVGIGTNSPTGKLTLYTDGDQTLRFSHPVDGTFPRTDRIVFGSPEVDGGSSAIYGVQTTASGAPGYLSFYTTNGGSSTEKMRITDGGNVGIGTTAPSSSLHVAGTITAATTADSGRINLGTQDTNQIGLYRDNTYDLVLLQDASSGNPLYLAGAGDVRVSIDSNNNNTNSKFIVGNNDKKSSNELFSVDESGSGYFSGSLTVQGTITAQKLNVQQITSSVVYSSGSNIFGNEVSNTQTFTGSVLITGSEILNGKLYLGTSSPSTANSLQLSYNTNSGDGVVSSYSSGGSTTLALQTSDAGSPTTRLYINSTGNVGIGTATPGYKLDVKGTGRFDDSVQLYAGSAGNSPRLIFGGETSSTDKSIFLESYYMVFQGHNNEGFKFQTTDSTGSITNRMVVLGSGNVGIGTTSPSAKLDIAGSTENRYLEVNALAGFAGISSGSNAMVEFLNASDGNNLFIKTSNSVRTDAAPLAVWTDNNPRLLVRNDGNVGIGIASPAYRLHVDSNTDSLIRVSNGTETYLQSTYFGYSSTYDAIQIGDTYGKGNNGVSVALGIDPSIIAGGAFSGYEIALPDLTEFITANGPSGSATDWNQAVLVITGSRIGISTGTPTQTLEVGGNILASKLGVGGAINTSYDLYNNGTTYLNGETTVDDNLYISGNVGIGTTSPLGQLDIRTTSGDTIFRSVVANGGTATSNDLAIKQDFITGVTANYLWSNSNYTLGVGRNSGTMPTTEAEATALSAFVINSSGNVGIGTASPAVKLDIQGSNTGTSLGDGMFLKLKNTSTTANTRAGIVFGNIDGIGGSLAMQSAILKNAATGEYDMTWDLYGGSAGWQEGLLYLDSNPGRVGIGTTSPLSPLHQVAGGVDYTGEARFGGSSTAFGLELKYNQAGSTSGSIYASPTYSSNDVLLKLGAGSGNANQLVLKGNGNVGIGTTSPAAKLEIKPSGDGDIFIGRYSGGSAKLIYAYQSSADGFLELRTGGDNIVTKLSGYSGTPSYFLSNVGIGTTSPAYKLHVSGAIAIENQGTTTIETTTFSGSLTTNTNIASVPTASFKAAFFDYYVASGSVNMRAGTVMAVHNNSTSRYTDTSTADIGTTAAVDFSTSIVAGSLVLTANISSGTWEVKTAYRAL